MRSFLTPTLCFCAALLAASPTLSMGADAAIATAPTVAMPSATDLAKVITVNNIQFNNAVSDPFIHNDWMVMRIDMLATAILSSAQIQALNDVEPSNQNAIWLDGVSCTVTLGWGIMGAKAQVDMAVSSTVKLAPMRLGNTCSLFFLVPPEILQRGIRGTLVNSRTPPTFYVIQFSIGSTALQPSNLGVSGVLQGNRAYVDGFLQAAAAKLPLFDGGLIPGPQAPFYVYQLALQNAPMPIASILMPQVQK